VAGTYETMVGRGEQTFEDRMKGTLNVTAGLGGMGGAQPLAITMKRRPLPDSGSE